MPVDCMIDTLRTVTFCQSHQLLSLTQAAPWKLPLEEFLDKVPRVLSHFLSFLAIEVGPTHREGRCCSG